MLKKLFSHALEYKFAWNSALENSWTESMNKTNLHWEDVRLKIRRVNKIFQPNKSGGKT